MMKHKLPALAAILALVLSLGGCVWYGPGYGHGWHDGGGYGWHHDGDGGGWHH